MCFGTHRLTITAANTSPFYVHDDIVWIFNLGHGTVFVDDCLDLLEDERGVLFVLD